MTNPTYEASVYTRKITYKNFKQETKEVELFFALDPIELLRVFAAMPTPKKSKSNNPARRAEEETTLSDEQSLKFLVDISAKAAGFPSDDGESWEPFEDFSQSIAGKAFITKLASSDTDREEFARKVILDPFEAFVNFAAADEGNTKEEIAEFRGMLEQMKRIFAVSEKRDGESPEKRRARLKAELASLENDILPDGQTGE